MTPHIWVINTQLIHIKNIMVNGVWGGRESEGEKGREGEEKGRDKERKGKNI